MSKHGLFEQADVIRQLRDLHVTIFGAGGAGRQIALQLVAFGLGKLTVVDSELVEQTDVAAAGYRADDVGRLKVDAVGDVCHQAQPLLDYTGVAEAFGPASAFGTHVFCCVEIPQARRNIQETMPERCRFWCDVYTDHARVSVSSIAGELATSRSKNWSASEITHREGGTGVVIEAGLAASLAVHQLLRHLGGYLQQKIMLDLATGCMEVSNGS